MVTMYLQFVSLLFLPTCLQQYIETAVDACDWDIYDCYYPYDAEVTKMFECNANDCPENFKCCSHRCFRHNICQPYKEITPEPQRIPKTIMTKPGQCDIVLSCDIDLPDRFIRQFECLQDDDCPDHFKCCYIECYGLKVCQPTKNEHIIFDYDQIDTSPLLVHTQSIASTAAQSSITQETTSATENNVCNKTDNDEDIENNDEYSRDYLIEVDYSSTDFPKHDIIETETTTTALNTDEKMNNIETILTTKSTQSTDTITTTRQNVTHGVTQSETTTKIIRDNDNDYDDDGDVTFSGSIVDEDGALTTDTITTRQNVTHGVTQSDMTTKRVMGNDDDYDDDGDITFTGSVDNEDGNVESSGDNEVSTTEDTTKNEIENDLVSSGDSDDEDDDFANSEANQSVNPTNFTDTAVTQNVSSESMSQNMDTATTVIYPTRLSRKPTVINVEIIREVKQIANTTDATTNYTESSIDDGAIISVIPLNGP